MLRDMPRYFDQQMVNMRAGLKRGFTPSQITLKGRDIGVAEVARAKSVEESPFYAPFREWPASISPELPAALPSYAAPPLLPAFLPPPPKLLISFSRLFGHSFFSSCISLFSPSLFIFSFSFFFFFFF